MNNNLSEEQMSACVDVLAKLNPGYLPKAVFSEIARLTRLPIVILIPVRMDNNNLAIGLLQRDNDDPWWPNLWHLAGTVFRSTDTTDDCIRRLIDEELFINSECIPKFRTFLITNSLRGAEIQFIYTIESINKLENSPMQWFDINCLPENMVDTEQKAINEIRQYYPK